MKPNLVCAAVTATMLGFAVQFRIWPLVVVLICLFLVLLVDVGVEAVRR